MGIIGREYIRWVWEWYGVSTPMCKEFTEKITKILIHILHQNDTAYCINLILNILSITFKYNMCRKYYHISFIY